MARRRCDLLITMLGSLLFLLSCNQDIEMIVNAPPYVQTSNLQEIIPLKSGNTWTYRFIEYYDFRPFTETTYVSRTVANETMFDSHPVYTIDGSLGEPFYEYTDSSSYVQYADFGSRYHPVRILNTPIANGHQWRFSLTDTVDIIPDSLEIVSSDSSVEIISRTFQHAIVVKGHTDDERWEFIIVPYVGIVRESYFHLFGGYSADLLSKNF